MAKRPVHSHGALLRRMEIALKPPAIGMHRIYVRGKGRKHVIADSAFERLQVGARACWLDTDEHHLGLAPWTGWALKRSRWNGGRKALGLGHGASLTKRWEQTLSVTGIARGVGRRWSKYAPQGSQTRADSGPLVPIAPQDEHSGWRHILAG